MLRGMKNIFLAFVVLGLLGCGTAPVDGTGGPLDVAAGPCSTTAGYGLLVSAQTCTQAPAAETVTCQGDGRQDGGPSDPIPLVGCMVTLLRSPDVQYTALCVASCDHQ